MAFVTYTAQRSLALGHVAGVEYTLPLSLTPATEFSVQDLKQKQQAMAGNVETQFFGQNFIWSVQLAPCALDAADLIREFLDSTAGGEEFMFDPYGTPEVPSRKLATVVREDEGYTEPRFLPVGRGGADDFVQYSFRVRTT